MNEEGIFVNPSDAFEVHDQRIGEHRVSFATKRGKLEWVIIDRTHFTKFEFEQMVQLFHDFQEAEDDFGFR